MGLPWLAAAAWLGAALGVRFGSTGLALAIAAGIGVAAAAHRRGQVVRWAGVGLVLPGVALIGVLSGQAVAVPPGLADRAVAVTLTVNGERQQIADDPSGGPRLAVPGTAESLAIGPQRWEVAIPIQVFAAAGPPWQGVAPGSTIRVVGRLETDESGRTTVSAVSRPVLLAAPAGLTARCNGVRSALRGALAAGPLDARSIVSGLVAGDESEQSPDFAEAMRLAGLSHLTAVSGGNITLVLAGVLGVVRLTRATIQAQVVVAGIVLAGYVALVGPQPSVIRAGAMGACGLVGVLAGGLRRGLPVLGTCVLLLVLVAPRLALELGFALSVAATASLLWLAPRLMAVLRPVVPWFPEPLVLALSVALAAQAATVPLLLAIGSPVSAVSVPANIAVAGLVGPVTVLGLLLALVASLPGGATVAGALAPLVLVPADVIVRVARVAAGLAQLDASRWLTIAVIAGALGWAGLALRQRWSAFRAPLPRVADALWRPGALWALPVGLALVLMAWRLAAPRAWVPPDWVVVVCDVGQGTAVLVRDGEGTAVLVDTGPPDGRVASCLGGAGITALDAVILTHEHIDHVGGLDDVLRAVPVGHVWVSPFALPAANSAHVHEVAARAGVPCDDLSAGATIGLASWRGEVLWPPAGFTGPEEEANDSSVVVRWTAPDGTALLTTGDVEPPSQSRLLALGAARLHSDIVVIPHHGSSHQDQGFVAAADPVVAVASAGEHNDYGHPSAATLLSYQSQGARVLRTDRDGGVAVAGSVAEGLRVTTESG